MNEDKSTEGFTIVEVVVTLAVITLFVTFFFQMYMMMESQRILVIRRAAASDIAYKNLRKFPASPGLATACASSGMDLTKPNPTGLTLGDESNKTTASPYGFIAEDTTSLGTGATQRVAAYAPYGCGSNVVKIISTITFGANNETISHVSYIQ